MPEDQEVASWLVCDHRLLRRYGLGVVRPTPLPCRHRIRAGYLKKGQTLEALAADCGIGPEGLKRTVAEYNQHTRQGEDPAFGRGSTP